MGYNVRLIVPTHNEAELGPIIGKIAGRWDGVTVSKATGWWYNDVIGPVKDQVSVLECSIGVDWWKERSTREWWYDLAGTVRESFDQDSVFLSVQKETAVLVGHGDHLEVIGA